MRAARAGDAPFVALLLKHHALVDLPSKEGVTPLMAAAGIEFGQRVTRGRNRTDEGVLATMRLLIDAGANVNARMVTESRAAAGGAGGRGGGRRGSQVPSPRPCRTRPHCAGAAARGFTAFVEFLAANGADLQAKDADGRTPPDLARCRGGSWAGAEPFPKPSPARIPDRRQERPGIVEIVPLAPEERR